MLEAPGNELTVLSHLRLSPILFDFSASTPYNQHRSVPEWVSSEEIQLDDPNFITEIIQAPTHAESLETCMPIYEYKCKRFGKNFEILVFGSKRRIVQCPACSGGSVARVMSPFNCLGVQLTKKFRMEAEEGLKKERVS